MQILELGAEVWDLEKELLTLKPLVTFCVAMLAG
jgi:hypothetical protein